MSSRPQPPDPSASTVPAGGDAAVPSPLERVRIVLVAPLYGGNVGSICRAMMNMGLSDLAVAAPREEGLDEDELRKMALTAHPIYERRKEFATAADAVADCRLVAATSARTGFYRDHARTPRAWVPRLLEAACDGPAAILFGREDKGLTNEEVALATQIIQIPSTGAYTSLNLSQAVMICAYELYVASGLFVPSQERYREASSSERERMYAKWRQALLDIGFMKEDKADHMMMGLRRILSRGPLTTADVQILMGIAGQATWAGNEAFTARRRPGEARETDEA